MQFSEMAVKALIPMTLILNHCQSRALKPVKPLFADVAAGCCSLFLATVADDRVRKSEVVQSCRHLFKVKRVFIAANLVND